MPPRAAEKINRNGLGLFCLEMICPTGEPNIMKRVKNGVNKATSCLVNSGSDCLTEDAMYVMIPPQT